MQLYVVLMSPVRQGSPWRPIDSVLVRKFADQLGCEMSTGLVADIAKAFNDGGSLDARACGYVYERSLAVNRVGRRASGSYYTPAHIVDFVVERALGPVLATRDAREALDIRVLDPACGGGVFLLAALDVIERHCVARGVRGGARLRAEIVERCLFGGDLDPRAVAVCRMSLALSVTRSLNKSVPARVTAGITQGDSLIPKRPLARNTQYDAVVGNPPWGQKGFRFSGPDQAYVREHYVTGRGVLDPCKLFIERAHDQCAEGGFWGFVLPDIILLKDQVPVRALMLKQSKLSWIVDLGRAFPGVNLDAVVILGQRCTQYHPGHRVSILHQLPEDWRRRELPSHSLEQQVFWELPQHRFNIHLSQRSIRLLRTLRTASRFGTLFEIHEGVHTGNSRTKLFSSSKRNQDCRPLIVGRGELSRYRLKWAGMYLDLGPRVIDRKSGDYANLGQRCWHERAKLVVRRTGDRIVAAYDNVGYHVTNNAFVVLPRRTMSERESLAWVGLLNSRFMTWYFRTVQPRTGRLFAELKIQHLAEFPVPEPLRWHEAVEQLAQHVSSITVSLDQDGPPCAESVAAIDRQVFELYGLSDDDRAFICGE